MFFPKKPAFIKDDEAQQEDAMQAQLSADLMNIRKKYKLEGFVVITATHGKDGQHEIALQVEVATKCEGLSDIIKRSAKAAEEVIVAAQVENKRKGHTGLLGLVGLIEMLKALSEAGETLVKASEKDEPKAKGKAKDNG